MWRDVWKEGGLYFSSYFILLIYFEQSNTPSFQQQVWRRIQNHAGSLSPLAWNGRLTVSELQCSEIAQILVKIFTNCVSIILTSISIFFFSLFVDWDKLYQVSDDKWQVAHKRQSLRIESRSKKDLNQARNWSLVAEQLRGDYNCGVSCWYCWEYWCWW